MIASYFNGWYVGSGNTRAFRYATTGSEMSRTYGTLSLQPFLSQPLKWLATFVMPLRGFAALLSKLAELELIVIVGYLYSNSLSSKGITFRLRRCVMSPEGTQSWWKSHQRPS